MTQDKEQEIRWQFLGEAEEYLHEIESVLLGISAHHINHQQIDQILRSAHSIKGGAAMMSFESLSEIAHRLEDFFKVLKASQSHLIDETLESLFLTSVDHLRQMIQQYRQKIDIDPTWLQEQVTPVIDALSQRLGDPQPEDTMTLLSEEAEEDMVLFMFQTEVENCLQRLESVFDDPQQPCLREEFSLAAQELDGLGQMLELKPFSALCQSIAQILETHPDDLATIARLALKEWRRSQALIESGQRDILPTQLILSQLASDTSIDSQHHSEFEAWEETFEALDDLPISSGLPSFGIPQPLFTEESSQFPEISSHGSKLGESENDSTSNLVDKEIPIPLPQTETKDSLETQDTVRVLVKQLDTLSDRFGELTIERNSLNLQLKRLHRLIELLGDRVQTLEKSNPYLRKTYDQVTPKTIVSSTLKRDSTNTTLQDFDLLEMDRYSDLHLVSQGMMDTIVQLQEVKNDLQLNLEEAERASRAFSRTSRLMQNDITQLRMRPISELVERFPRGLRQMERQYGKSVTLKIKGGSTLVDRAVLEILQDPLLHLFRNAFAHGIEPPQLRQAIGKPPQGTIEISAAYRGNQTLITIQDDGAGIDLDKIRAKALQMGLNESDLEKASKQDLLDLIFEPGFSTANEVTDLSGRGVGMDVVRTNLHQIHGDIQVSTELGKGTTFTLTVPLTLSVVRVLLVESGGMLLAFPNTAIEEMISLDPKMVISSAGQTALNWEGYLVPFVILPQWFHFSRPPQIAPTSETMPVIDESIVLMVAQGDDFIGIQADRYWGEEEVTIRQVEGNLGMPPGFAGCTILGDGCVVPLVDVPSLLNWMNGDRTELSPSETPLTDQVSPTVMVVDDSINVRRFLALTLEKAGYQVEQAQDGQDALEKLRNRSASMVQLVISDVEMPRLDGYGLLTQLKSDAVYQNLPVVMLTSRSGDKHRQLAMNLGASAYFSKPFKETELLTTIQQLINL